jgi:pimeloyl-ACP methyl ester carboxylesterase
MPLEPYEVHVPQDVLDDLRDRLGRTRWPDAVEAAGWDYGTDLDYLRDLMEHWAHRFDWRAQEEVINEFAHFRAEIDGTGIHLVHERGAGTDPLPLLLLHGWPSSFLQMLKILPLLTDPASFGGDPADSFHVVVPDLPGYGFSDRPTQRGMANGPIGELLHTLMTEELGYARYAVRASDIGAGVASALAMAHPEALIGLHMSGSNPFLDLEHLPDDLSPAEQRMVEDARRFRTEEFAYALLQVSKPQTPAYALNDSPAGLAAWIVEKYRAWSDSGGDVETAFTREELLSHLTVYWATQTIGSSMRLYYENSHATGGWGTIQAPTGIAMLPADMFPTPREWLERNGPLAHYTVLPRGGHVGEQEVPDLLAADLATFLRPLR